MGFIIEEDGGSSELDQLDQLKKILSQMKDNRHLATISTVYAFVDEFAAALDKLVEKPFFDPDASKPLVEALGKITTCLEALKPQPIDLSAITKSNNAIAAALAEQARQNAEIIKLLSASPKTSDDKNSEAIRILTAMQKTNDAMLVRMHTSENSEVLKAIAKALSSNKPTECEFEIKRLPNGKMDKIIFKP